MSFPFSFNLNELYVSYTLEAIPHAISLSQLLLWDRSFSNYSRKFDLRLQFKATRCVQCTLFITTMELSLSAAQAHTLLDSPNSGVTVTHHRVHVYIREEGES